MASLSWFAVGCSDMPSELCLIASTLLFRFILLHEPGKAFQAIDELAILLLVPVLPAATLPYARAESHKRRSLMDIIGIPYLG